MNYSLVVAFFISSLFASLASCGENASVSGNPKTSNSTPDLKGSQMRIRVGSSTFTATLYDNATATAFKARLPMTVRMTELNGNEKYVDLSGNLPVNVSNPGTIQNGDLMLYGANTLVLFYKAFSTSYRYTKLGRINDTTGLAATLGSGSVTVTFELER
ncbi:hypothetical protein HNV11_09970 [Spirosoma taeanense]|uniref:Cyclophilin-like domain-containing protein n=2 Tax=Spirosoma taeanense TaxID=2735870 RepID=A0A6M5Y719_9BACT|nr:hypothetical protein HNV11_09970 [Spirosoma taeanense]